MSLPTNEELAETFFHHYHEHANSDVSLESEPTNHSIAAIRAALFDGIIAEAKSFPAQSWVAVSEPGYGPDDYFSDGIALEVGTIAGTLDDWLTSLRDAHP